MRLKMLLNKICAGSMLLIASLAYANGDCVQEERIALAQPGMRQDLRGFQLGEVEKMDAATLRPRIQAAEARAGSLPAAALYACLARAELQRREGSNNTTTADDPKARGRSARVM